jgi:hypothetical protein
MLRSHAPAQIYERIFEPAAAQPGPSGLENWPRPFVFRASHLDGLRFGPGDNLHFDLNLFDLRLESFEAIRHAFEELGRAGFGPRRGKAALQSSLVEPVVSTIELSPAGPDISEILIDFVTPMELKGGGEVLSGAEFAVLFARIRDRISTLRALYGPGPLEINFKEMGSRAGLIRRSGGELSACSPRRRSSRTGQVHAIGGFTGWARYQGELREFLPYLRAAEWSGVGRHCVWGNGQIRVNVCK